MRTILQTVATLLLLAGSVLAANLSISGRVIDFQGHPVPGATVQLTQQPGVGQQTKTNDKGRFEFQVPSGGEYVIKADAAGFEQVKLSLAVTSHVTSFDVLLGKISARNESVTVTANVDETTMTAPDPGQRVMVRQELLDANPGRPGVPVSIPGLPVETASGGIKAPQYFAPGVAGDHGEPIAQYFKIGSFLYPNNLPANAHGNGYADPNFLIPPVIEQVTVDGGAFNVREGNNAIDLAADYVPRKRLTSFVQLTGDFHDVDLMAGWGSANPHTDEWIAMEASFGDGFLERLEHRQQYKLNGLRQFKFRQHQLTLFGIGYYGFSYVPGLIPINVPVPGDTIDNRQLDTTHNVLLIATDNWKLDQQRQFSFSGFFRNYALTLRSNFGDGLIQ